MFVVAHDKLLMSINRRLISETSEEGEPTDTYINKLALNLGRSKCYVPHVLHLTRISTKKI